MAKHKVVSSVGVSGVLHEGAGVGDCAMKLDTCLDIEGALAGLFKRYLGNRYPTDVQSGFAISDDGRGMVIKPKFATHEGGQQRIVDEKLEDKSISFLKQIMQNRQFEIKTLDGGKKAIRTQVHLDVVIQGMKDMSKKLLERENSAAI